MIAAEFITPIWASETNRTLEFMKSLGILVGPAYPHRQRWGFHWWHRHCCYSCVQARVIWPMMRKRIEIKLGMLSFSSFKPLKEEVHVI